MAKLTDIFNADFHRFKVLIKFNLPKKIHRVIQVTMVDRRLAITGATSDLKRQS